MTNATWDILEGLRGLFVGAVHINGVGCDLDAGMTGAARTVSQHMKIDERMPALALDALAEQERQVSEVRSRASALLAAGAVVASLLGNAIVHGRGSHIVIAAVFLEVDIVAAGVLSGFSLALLWPKEVAFSLNASKTYRWLDSEGLTDEVAMNLALADNLQDLRADNANDVVESLTSYLRFAVVGLAVETSGLAIAAAAGVFGDRPVRRRSFSRTGARAGFARAARGARPRG